MWWLWGWYGVCWGCVQWRCKLMRYGVRKRAREGLVGGERGVRSCKNPNAFFACFVNWAVQGGLMLYYEPSHITNYCPHCKLFKGQRLWGEKSHKSHIMGQLFFFWASFEQVFWAKNRFITACWQYLKLSLEVLIAGLSACEWRCVGVISSTNLMMSMVNSFFLINDKSCVVFGQ